MPNTIRHVDHESQLQRNAPEPNRHLRPMIKGKPRFFWNSIQEPACIDTEFQLRQDWSHEHDSLGIDSDKCGLGDALYASIVAWQQQQQHHHHHRSHHNRTGQVHVDLFCYSVALGASSQCMYNGHHYHAASSPWIRQDETVDIRHCKTTRQLHT